MMVERERKTRDSQRKKQQDGDTERECVCVW